MYVYIYIHMYDIQCDVHVCATLCHAAHCRAQNLRPAPIKLWLGAASHQHRSVSLEL